MKQLSENMTAAQRELYGKYFEQFASAMNHMQGSGLPAKAAAARIIELSEQVPAPSRAAVGEDAEEILRMVREKSDEALDKFRSQLFGFDQLH
jgi:hypothetical protein